MNLQKQHYFFDFYDENKNVLGLQGVELPRLVIYAIVFNIVLKSILIFKSPKTKTLII